MNYFFELHVNVVSYVQNKTHNALFIIHISSLIIITITHKFRAAKITMDEAKINNTFYISKNSP